MEITDFEFAFDKKKPHNILVEENLLGAMIITKNIDVALDILSKDVFYKDAHREIWTAITELYHEKAPIDVISVTNQLKKKGKLEMAGGVLGITDIINKVTFSDSIDYNARLLYELYVKREVITLSQESALLAYEDSTDCFDLIEQIIEKVKLLEPRGYQSTTTTDANDLMLQYFKDIESGKMVGVPTGFKSFDKHTGGLQKSDLIVVGSFSSNGKTATAINILTYAGSLGFIGKIYTFEQSLVQLYMRQIAILSNLNTKDIIRHRMFSHENVIRAQLQLKKQKTLYSSAGNHINDLVVDIRREVKKNGLQYVIIDYLQLMRSNERKRNESMGYIANRLKELANELNIPIVLISQLSRPQDGKKVKPRLSMLKESGDIENAADIAWLPWIPGIEPTELEVVEVDGIDIPTVANGKKLMLHNVAKGRNCGVTRFTTWIDDTLKIEEENREDELWFKKEDDVSKDDIPF